MEANSPRLASLLDELTTLTWLGELQWTARDDGRSCQYAGPKAAVIVSSESEAGFGPFKLVSTDSKGAETDNLLEVAPSEGDEVPPTWNGSLAYLYSLAMRSSGSSPAPLLDALGIKKRAKTKGGSTAG
jgi:hypothetical protein